MQAVVFHEFGGPDVLKLEEVADPQPGAGEVLIDIAVGALNHLDVDIREGVSRFPSSRRSSSASRSSGGSRRSATGVDGWQVGERVMPYLMGTCGECRYCRTGRESLCLTPGFVSFTTSGGYAEKLACPARQLDPGPGRALGRGRGRDPDRVRHRLAHALHAREAPAGRDGADQLRRQRDRLGRGAAREARRRVRDRQRRARTTSSRARRSSGSTSGSTTRPRTWSTRSCARPTAAASTSSTSTSAASSSSTASTRSRRTAGWSSAAPTRARSCPSTSSRSSGAQKQIIGSFVYNRDEVEKVLDLAARGLVKPLVYKTFPLEQARDAMETDGAPRALRQDRPQPGRCAREAPRRRRRRHVHRPDLRRRRDGADPRPQAPDDAGGPVARDACRASGSWSSRRARRRRRSTRSSTARRSRRTS